MKIASSLLIAASLVVSSFPAHASFEPVTCKNAFTMEQEIAEGNKVAAQVYQKMPVLPDNDPISRYVQQLGARVVASAPLTPGLNQPWPFNFHVVASQDINAFAVPGGAVFVNLGTIQAAETEAQLAGVIAHETSHVVMRHSTCNLTKQQHRGLLYGLGEIGSEVLLGNGAAGQLAQTGLGLGQNLDFLHMSRDDERQADLLGTDVLARAGYDPRGLPQFFETIQAKYGAGGAQLLSDHPNPGNRTQYVNAEIATLQQRPNPIVNTNQFRQIHAASMTRPVFTAEQVQAGTWKSVGQYASGPGSYNAPPYDNRNNGNGGYANDSNRNNGNGTYGTNGGNGNGGYGNDGQQNNGTRDNGNGGYANEGNRNNGNNNGNGGYRNEGDRNGGNNGTRDNGSAGYGDNGYGNNGQPGIGPAGAPLDRSRTGLGLNAPLQPLQTDQFTVNVPSTWQRTSDAVPVSLYPPGGGGPQGLAYGALIDTARDVGFVSDASTLSQGTAKVIQMVLQQNTGLQQVGGVSTLRVGGRHANAVEFRGQSPISRNGTPLAEHDWLVTVTRPDGNLSYIVFVAPEADFAMMKPTFQAMLSSFRTR